VVRKGLVEAYIDSEVSHDGVNNLQNWLVQWFMSEIIMESVEENIPKACILLLPIHSQVLPTIHTGVHCSKLWHM
jgi:hypothetical protein